MTEPRKHFMTLPQQQAAILRLMAARPERLWLADELLCAVEMPSDDARDPNLPWIMSDLCNTRSAKIPGVALPVVTVPPVKHLEPRDCYVLLTEVEFVLEYIAKLESAPPESENVFA